MVYRPVQRAETWRTSEWHQAEGVLVVKSSQEDPKVTSTNTCQTHCHTSTGAGSKRTRVQREAAEYPQRFV
jgi:hypothetical protein